jgi:hypothetical protein
VAVFGCKAPKTVTLASPDLSGDVGFVSVLAWDDAGTLIHSTGLVRRSADMPAFVLEKGADSARFYDVLGYSRSEIEALGSTPADDRLFASNLRPAVADEPRLPDPIFAERFDAASPGQRSAHPAPPLTVDWLAPCGEAGTSTAPGVVDISCTQTPCFGTLAEHGCKLDIDLSGPPCSFGHLTATLGGQRQVSLDSMGSFKACNLIAARAPAAVSVSCSTTDGRSCTIDGYAAPVAPLAITVTSTHVPHGPPPNLSDGLFREPQGYVSGLAVLTGKVVVAHHAAFAGWMDCDGAPSLLSFLDPETLAISQTKQSVPCIHRVAKDPLGAGFVAAYAGSRHRIARFDDSGAMVVDRAIALPRLEARHAVASMAVSATPPAIYLLYSEDEDPALGAPTQPPIVVALDAHDLSITATVALPPGRFLPDQGAAGVLAVLNDGTVAAGETSTETLYFYDQKTLAAKSKLEIRTLCTETRGFAQSAMFEPVGTSRLFIGGTDPDTSAVFEAPLPGLASCDHVNFYPSSGAMYAQVSWSGGLIITAVTEHITKTAHLALLDPANERFLPATIELGIGPVIGFAKDGERAWMALPWTGTIVRASPH